MSTEAQIINGGAAYFPSLSRDSIAVYTQDYEQVFPKARVMKVLTSPTSKLMDNPLESGATVTDHRILLPTEITLPVFLKSGDYRDTYQKIKQLFVDGTFLIVETLADTYKNMVIAECPHEEDADIYDSLIVNLKFREVQIVTAQYEPVPANPVNKSTVKRGNIEGQPASTSQTSQTGSILSKATGIGA